MKYSNDPQEQEELPEEEVEVTISVTLSKTIKVLVNDYSIEVGKNEDGNYCNKDFSECDLYKAVEDQVTLPQYLADYTENMFEYDLDLKAAGMCKGLKEAIKDCQGWCVDDFEVVLNK